MSTMTVKQNVGIVKVQFVSCAAFSLFINSSKSFDIAMAHEHEEIQLVKERSDEIKSNEGTDAELEPVGEILSTSPDLSESDDEANGDSSLGKIQ